MAWDSEHVAKARQHLEQRLQQRRLRYGQLHAQAVHDFAAILEMMVRDFHPERVYQWGSVLRPELFRDYSDIDIAVEGITAAGFFFAMLRDAEGMTVFPVDIVQMETIHPAFAQSIRERGRIVHER